MKVPSRSKIDFKVITGPYQVFGVLLTVTEGLLGYWLYRAEGGIERGFAGLLMALVLFGVLFAVILIKREDSRALASRPGEATSIKPPEGQATETQIATPSSGTMPGPDRSYLINLPPEGWRERELTLSAWLSEGLGVEDPATKERLFPSAGQSPEILIFERQQQTSIIPIPGRTMIDGRKFPTALETFVPTQLSIIPSERAQPPLFVERPLEHNFLTFVGQILNVGVITATNLEFGTIHGSGRRYLAADLKQKIQDAIVNGKESQDVVVTIRVIGIEGELRDHLLIMKYTTVPGDPEAERNLQTLQDLVASFGPLKAVNVEEKRRQIAALANENFKKLLTEKGEDIFMTEFGFLLLRLQGVSLEDPGMRVHVMKLLKPFETFAGEINLHNEEVDSFWEALHRAETGDATDFKAKLNQLIEVAARREEEKQEKEIALPPPPHTEPDAPAA
jgi:hypothetical protein